LRILVDCSNYFLNNQNYGDLAMYVMTSRRLRRCWPRAEISWLTLDAPMLERHVPGICPWVLQRRQRSELFSPSMFRPLQPTSRWRRRIRRRESGVPPELPVPLVGSGDNMVTVPDADRLVQELRGTDLVVATGGGYFSDMFPEHACGILETLAGGRSFGLPSVVLGAGFEPVTNPDLKKKAASVLPNLDLVACREGDYSPGALREFGVSPERIRIVGDEALELAWEARSGVLGGGIGINLRQARYSGLSDDIFPILREVLARASREKRAPLLPVPISMFGPSDCETIRRVLPEQGAISSGGEELENLPRLFEQLTRCRILVTGSYHAAVFALGQGISVVAVARSLHYLQKTGGLAHQFGAGCTLVPLDDPDLAHNLSAAIDDAWGGAEGRRQEILASVKKSIRFNNRVYRELKSLVPWKLGRNFIW
jgi:polysaccharide pyruvyl transferase WcaK-like protein